MGRPREGLDPRTVSVSLCGQAQDPAARRPGSLGAFGEWIKQKKGPWESGLCTGVQTKLGTEMRAQC